MDYLKVYCDGGSRGNPGPAGIGVVIIKGGCEKKFNKYLGQRTNNQAEYEAVIFALNLIKSKYLSVSKINFYLDSELVVKQMNGDYKIKNKKLQLLFLEAKKIINNFGFKVKFIHIKREKNYQADKLVNKAIDKRAL